MGNFRFYRRARIFPGLSLNLSKSGPSLTVGVRGAHVTFGSRGVTRTVGIPGTGLYYTSRSGYHTGVHSAHVETAETSAAAGKPDRSGALAVLILVAAVFALGIIIGAALGH